MSTVRIIYKSGATIDVKCDDFAVKSSGSTIVSISWDNAHPRPLHVGVGEVAAVWEVKP